MKKRSGLGYGLILLSLVPLALTSAYIADKAQPVPYWDEWIEPLDNAIKTAEGRVGWEDVFRQYNDSRPVFTNVMTVISTRLLSWNLEAEMFANVLLASAFLLVAWSTYRSQDSDGAPFLLLPLSAVVFSPAQNVSWLWSIQSQYFFLTLFLMIGLAVLSRRSVGYGSLLFAAIAATASSFSFANGFLAFFVLLPVLWMCGYRRRIHYLFFAGMMAIGLGAFFHGYEHRLATGFEASRITGALQFLFAYLGNWVRESGVPKAAADVAIAQFVGAAALALMALDVTFLRRRETSWKVMAPWLGLAGFVAVSGALAGWARFASFGVRGAMASRYTALTFVFWVGLLALASLAVKEALRPSRTSRPMASINLLAALLVAGCWIQASVRSPRQEPRITESHYECLSSAPTTRNVDCLYGLHPVFDPSHPSYDSRYLAMKKIDRMKELRLGVFATAED